MKAEIRIAMNILVHNDTHTHTHLTGSFSLDTCFGEIFIHLDT